MLLVRIALRNLMRHRRRGILTALAIGGGFALAVFSICWADGTYEMVIDGFTSGRTGHIQIHVPGWLEHPHLEDCFEWPDTLSRLVASTEGVRACAPRTYGYGLAGLGERTSGVRVVGFDPRLEAKVTRLGSRLSAGSGFGDSPVGEVLLGAGLAKVLGASIGDSLPIVAQGADGSLADRLYRICGFVETGDPVADRMACYLHIRDAQDLFCLGARVHEIAVSCHHLRDVGRAVGALRHLLASKGLEVQPWQVFAASFYRAMKADLQGMWIMLVVILVIVAVVVLNTVLMGVLERTREFGVLRALGTRPVQIVLMVLTETLVLASLAMLLGLLLAVPAVWYVSVKGLSLEHPLSYGGVVFRSMRTSWSPWGFYAPAVLVLVVSLLVAVPPALRASRVSPAKAMRLY